MNVIKRIEELRLERNWSKYKLAEEAMLTYSTLSAMYSRETPPKIEILEMLCNAFKISLAQFFSGDGEAESVNEEEKKLLKKFRVLSAEKRKAIITLLTDE
ncbi:MAG: helix-turn-helix transcriptional regulator [Clostridia bacterium]|nr:helix-turn-helix transcriptional regulator [Clostridia bacterium]